MSPEAADEEEEEEEEEVFFGQPCKFCTEEKGGRGEGGEGA
jgi:hypothetical protein